MSHRFINGSLSEVLAFAAHWHVVTCLENHASSAGLNMQATSKGRYYCLELIFFFASFTLARV
jgi:hypothetical protein